MQTLRIALDTLLEARDDSNIDDATRIVFMGPDGTEYRLGMFALYGRDTDDEQLVVDLIPAGDPAT